MGLVVAAPTFPVPDPFVNVNSDVWNVVDMRGGQREEYDSTSSGSL